jgi:hypothetical protein
MMAKGFYKACGAPLLAVIASAAKQSRKAAVPGNPGLLRRIAPYNDEKLGLLCRGFELILRWTLFSWLLFFMVIVSPARGEDIPVSDTPDAAAPPPPALSVAEPVAAEEPSMPELSPPGPAPMDTKHIAVLQALDKVTGRIHVLNVPVDQPAQFVSLAIDVRSCRKSLPEDSPESAAFLEIEETTPKGEKRPVFSGWMFASSPAVSAMEHPMFDVWVVECRD